MTMPIDFRTESLREPVASRDTAISCLVRLGAQNGVNLRIETVRDRASTDGDTITVSRLIKLADECGLQLKWVRLDWQGLNTSGFSELLIFRENTHCIVLTGGAPAEVEKVSIWDPHHDGVIFYMGRAEFERGWSGHALMITPKAPTSPSQQSAFNAIASEIRGAPGDIAKPESPGNPAPVAGSLSPGNHGGPTRHWRKLLLGFAAVGAVASVTIFLLVHLGENKAVSIGTPARGNAARAEYEPSAGETPERPSTNDAAASTSTRPARIISAPMSAEPHGELSSNISKTSVASTPEMTSTPATSEPPALATRNASPPGPKPGAPNAGANPTDTAPASEAISVGSASSATTPSAASSSANELSAETPAAPATGLTEARLSTADTAALLARGDVLFSKGDVVAARLFYERAAYAGEGQAALRLAETFDPVFLDQARLRGARGDLSTALSWYRRARDLGVAEAEILLKSLETR
jgi:Peptidase C39 family